MPIANKIQWGLIMRPEDYRALDAAAASRGETRQEYVRRVLMSQVARDAKRAGR